MFSAVTIVRLARFQRVRDCRRPDGCRQRRCRSSPDAQHLPSLFSTSTPASFACSTPVTSCRRWLPSLVFYYFASDSSFCLFVTRSTPMFDHLFKAVFACVVLLLVFDRLRCCTPDLLHAARLALLMLDQRFTATSSAEPPHHPLFLPPSSEMARPECFIDNNVTRCYAMKEKFIFEAMFVLRTMHLLLPFPAERAYGAKKAARHLPPFAAFILLADCRFPQFRFTAIIPALFSFHVFRKVLPSGFDKTPTVISHRYHFVHPPSSFAGFSLPNTVTKRVLMPAASILVRFLCAAHSPALLIARSPASDSTVWPQLPAAACFCLCHCFSCRHASCTEVLHAVLPFLATHAQLSSSQPSQYRSALPGSLRVAR